jgi:hypothetical protein
MIRLISRLFTSSPLSDSNRRPLPYHESGAAPLTRTNRLQIGRIGSLTTTPLPGRYPADPSPIGTRIAAHVPIRDHTPDDIRACFPDQNRAIAERLAGVS